MKEKQGGTESPFALVTEAYGIFMRHYSEVQKEEAESHE